MAYIEAAAKPSETQNAVRLHPPPMLVLLTAFCASALVTIGFISQPSYIPMHMPDQVSFGGFAPRQLLFNVNKPPNRPGNHCVVDPSKPADKCNWYLYLGDQLPEDRVRLLLDEGETASNDVLYVRYGDSDVMAQPATKDRPAPVMEARSRLLVVYALVFAVFGLFVLWRGRAAAVWLGLFCLCLAPSFLSYYGLLSTDGMVAAWTIGVMLRRFADFALFAMALVLVMPYLKPRTTIVLAAAGFTLWILAVAFALIPKYEGFYLGYEDALFDPLKGRPIALMEVLLLGVLPLTLLLFGWTKAREPERSRLNIVAAVVLIGVVGPIVDGAAYGTGHFSEWTLIALAIPLGFTYAIPRYHVIDVGFVINRIVIYALLIGLVSAAIALAEVLITKTTAEPLVCKQDFQCSLVHQVPVVFVIVLTLRWLHTRLEEFVNQVLFRKRHKALNELKDFIRRTDFAETREGLLRGAVHEIGKALGTRGVAIYERSAHGYRRVENSGAFPQHVVDDDPAIWFMRAEREHVPLLHMGSSLGESGVAFPMCLRSALYGAVVCGPRINEEYEGDYAPDEIDVMQELAARLGEQLFALSAEAILNAETTARGHN